MNASSLAYPEEWPDPISSDRKRGPAWQLGLLEGEAAAMANLSPPPPLPRRSSTSTADLLWNCDLPPPQKVFVPTEKDEMNLISTFPLTNKIKPSGDELGFLRTALSASPKANNLFADELGLDRGDSDSGDLLRAMRLSQTRAREAETKASALSKRSKQIADLLLGDSMKLYAHQQWVKLLEIEVALLEKERREQCSRESITVDNGDSDVSPAATWCMALALFLGVAGVGFAVSYRYLF